MRALFAWQRDEIQNHWEWIEHTQAADGQMAVALLGPVVEVSKPFSTAIPSWAAKTSGDSWIEVELRAESRGEWTGFYRLGRWDMRHEGSARRSFDAQRNQYGRVATDTLVLTEPCQKIQARVLLCGLPEPQLDAFYLALGGASTSQLAHGRLPFVLEIEVPLRSQMIYPNGGNVWCSPTSVTMMLAYWYSRTSSEQLASFNTLQAVPEIAVPLVYDPEYDGHGNWIFNTAFAASQGMVAHVAQFRSLDDLTPWLQAGVPVVISVAWKQGTLQNAAIPSSNGHLLIVTGFDGEGGVWTADPAGATADEVRRRYDAVELESAWQNNSSGAVYLIYPQGWPVPAFKNIEHTAQQERI